MIGQIFQTSTSVSAAALGCDYGQLVAVRFDHDAMVTVVRAAGLVTEMTSDLEKIEAKAVFADQS